MQGLPAAVPLAIPVEMAPTNIPSGQAVFVAGQTVETAPAETPEQRDAASLRKRKFRPELFGKDAFRSTPTPMAARRRPEATPRTEAGTDAQGNTQQHFHVESDQQLHERLVQGDWGTLCRAFLSERGAPLLPAAALERARLDANPDATPGSSSPADALLFEQRAGYAAQALSAMSSLHGFA